MRILEGNVVAEGIKIGIVAARLTSYRIKTGWRCTGCLCTSRCKR